MVAFWNIRNWFKRTRKPTLSNPKRHGNASYRLSLEMLEDRCLPSAFIVIGSDDGLGTVTPVGGFGGAQDIFVVTSLRRAIELSNLDSGGSTPNTIRFAIPVGTPTVFQPATAYPTITTPVDIDGTTQAGYANNTPVVKLDGTNTAGNGLTITAANCTIRGLIIDNFSRGNGVEIGTTTPIGPNASTNSGGDCGIFNNIIGTDAANTMGVGNRQGIFIRAFGNNDGLA